LFRHRRLGVRRVLELGEIERNGDASVVYRWNMRNDTFVQISDLARIAEVISLYGGYTRTELQDDLNEKGEVLNWMVNHNVLEVNNSGYVIASYYKDKANVLGIVRQNKEFSPDLFN
jgi:hypothetical protein